MKLAAANELAHQIPSYEISRRKTPFILGESLDILALEADNGDEDAVERLDASPEQLKMLKKHMVAESKSFRDLENLIQALLFIEGAASVKDALEEQYGIPSAHCFSKLIIFQIDR